MKKYNWRCVGRHCVNERFWFINDLWRGRYSILQHKLFIQTHKEHTLHSIEHSSRY
jgi:hypothetical protein